MNTTCAALIYHCEVLFFVLWGDMKLCTRTLDLRNFKEVSVNETWIFKKCLDIWQSILLQHISDIQLLRVR